MTVYEEYNKLCDKGKLVTWFIYKNGEVDYVLLSREDEYLKIGTREECMIFGIENFEKYFAIIFEEIDPYGF